MQTSFPRLFSPVRIGSMQLANRIVMSPITTDYGNINQEPTDRLMAYLEERAKGGLGLITLEVCSVALDHRYQVNSLSLADDRFIPMHRNITDMLHRYGVKVQPLITHPGPESLSPFFENRPGVGPAINVNPTSLMTSRALLLDEIPGVIDQYARAALRARQAGYDGIELHAAHSYMLLGSFLSHLRNARQDDYGGKRLANRARLLIETVQAIKNVAGDDFPVTVSLSGYERFPGGRDLNETQRLAQMLVAAGADAFRISGGVSDALVSQMIMGSHYPDGINAAAAQAIKQVVDVPVIVVGRIHDPVLAESILVEGKADMIAIARPLLADSQWANKAKAGQAADIRRCISCQNCIDTMITAQNMNCAVNAQTGRELHNRLETAPKRKRVVIIGAGPAGMEAARVCSLRGHEVILLERQNKLGGSLVLASTVHADNQPFLDWLTAQVRQLPIDIRLSTSATPDMVRNLKTDVLIIASGAQMHNPALEGSQLPMVFSGSQLRRLMEGRFELRDLSFLPGLLQPVAALFLKITNPFVTPARLRQATRLWLPLGKRVAVLGGDLAALELAEFLQKRGRQVFVFEEKKLLAREVGPKRLHEHMDRLDRLGVVVNTEIRFLAIEKGAFRYSNAVGQEKRIAVDNVIIAGEPQADESMQGAYLNIAGETHLIGDVTGLGLIRKATDDGMRVACSI